MQQEFDRVYDAAHTYGDILRAWKVYTPWGDIPYASGWFLDDRVGRKFCEKVIEVGNATGVPKTVCCHKGFALPAFDQRAASPRDIGPVARDYNDEGLKIIVYHSGYTGGTSQLSTQIEDGDGPYPGDANWDSAKLGTNSLVKSLSENGWSARHFAPGGQPGVAGPAGYGDPTKHGNSPNVYAEIGSAWAAVFGDPEKAAHMLLKLIYYVGPKRVVWGTDSLWFGSPQTVISALRTYTTDNASEKIKQMYALPWGIDGDVDDPSIDTRVTNQPERSIRNAIFGRNAAAVYGMDPAAHLNAIACDDVQKIRDAYLINPLTPDPRQAAPLRSNAIPGYRSRRELIKDIALKPWGP
jgi:predicted TIM-barrel fold metal-dependent hydrolase